MAKTERWGMRFNYWRHRAPEYGGPAIQLHRGYCPSDTMPRDGWSFKDLPDHVQQHFGCDGKGFLPSTVEWKEFCSRFDCWNSDGVYDSIDVSVCVRNPL